MTVLLHDSGRTWKMAWTLEALSTDAADGLVLSPFETPLQADDNSGRRPTARDCVERVSAAGGVVLLDPMTHGVVVPGSNAFDIYDGWGLWDGQRGDLSSSPLRRNHVERVIERQRELGLTPVAPTVALHSSADPESDWVTDMAAGAVEVDAGSMIAIVGTPSFWSQGAALDEFVGQLASLRPSGWLLTLARNTLRLTPVVDAPDEVQGLCRTVHSLSLRSPVHVQHADLCGLAPVAAGASSIGTGWDLRQRMWAGDAFRRESTGGRAARRITHGGLLAVYRRQEAELLRAADGALSTRLVPGAMPVTMKEEWEHHLRCIGQEVDAIDALGSREEKVSHLLSQYGVALENFAAAETAAAPFGGGSVAWIEAPSEGLRRYAVEEGLI